MHKVAHTRIRALPLRAVLRCTPAEPLRALVALLTCQALALEGRVALLTCQALALEGRVALLTCQALALEGPGCAAHLPSPCP